MYFWFSEVAFDRGKQLNQSCLFCLRRAIRQGARFRRSFFCDYTPYRPHLEQQRLAGDLAADVHHLTRNRCTPTPRQHGDGIQLGHRQCGCDDVIKTSIYTLHDTVSDKQNVNKNLAFL